jgi:hypothetical protein
LYFGAHSDLKVAAKNRAIGLQAHLWIVPNRRRNF